MVQENRIQIVGDVLRARAQQHPDRLFWWVGDDRATYAEADQRSDRIASGLAEIGIKKGDRVALLSANRWEYLEAIFALAKLGAIQVPLNAYLRGDFLQYQIEQAEADAVMADAPGVEALNSVLDRVPSVKKIIVFDEGSRPKSDAELVLFETLRKAQKKPPRPDISPSDLVSIMYTSGTTGMPKGCMLPHGYYINFATEARGLVEVHEGDVIYTTLPLYHGHGQILAVMTALCEGLTVVLDPAFSASSIIDRWIETGATIFHAVGMMSMAMLRQPPSDKDRAHKVRGGLSVPLPLEAQRKFRERFGVNMSTGGYGQTECAPTSMSLPGDMKPGSQGKPAPYYHVAVVDDHDNILPPGEVGEIVVRPKYPNVMYAGYWRQPEATIQAWRNLWHHTGDFGKFDDEGFLYFVDRKKDALRRRGENISSMELEAAILKHPKIKEAAVVAIPSELTDDEVMACLVLAPGESIEPEELFEFFKSSLPYFTVPRYVRVFDEMPKTATLRVRKHLLRSENVTPDTWDFEAMDLRVSRTERR